MKWIQDLPDDFTQDFKFSVTGVDDPHTWLNDELETRPTRVGLDCHPHPRRNPRRFHSSVSPF